MRGVILDENLPRSLRLPTALPQMHAAEIAASAKDSVLWNYARLNGWAILTKDADFSNRIILTSAPPWVVHLRFGNMRLVDFKRRVQADWAAVEKLIPRHKLIRVHIDRIEAIE